MLTQFLALTFAISLAGFACIYVFPAARSPESLTGLPFWLVMVWGPSLAAMILSHRQGQLGELMARALRVSTVPWEAWALILAPLVLLALMRPFAPDESLPIGAGMIVLMVVFNLMLGPLGEELGWRGIMQTRLQDDLGWLSASLVVGAVWFSWHLPLWTIDSPHAAIPLHLFAAHCMLYAVIIGAAGAVSAGSLVPAIALHLTFNLASNGAVFAGFRNPEAWFSASLLPLAGLAALAIAMVAWKTGELGLRANAQAG